MFVKHGDGKVVAIIEEDTLTEEQKVAAEKMKKKVVKQSDKAESSDTNKLGN